MAYATFAEYRADTDLNASDAATEAIIERLLDAASNTIDRICNRLDDGFVADPVAVLKYYTGDGRPYILIDECVAITTVAVKEAASSTDYTAWTTPTTPLAGDGDWIPFSGDPMSPEFNRLPYSALMVDPNGDNPVFTTGRWVSRGGFRPSTEVPRGLPTVQVTARWGYSPTIPPDIKEACIMQTSRWYKRLTSGMSDTLASVELGQLLYTRKLDPDIELILFTGRYVRRATGRR